jgi:hypothetical protein
LSVKHKKGFTGQLVPAKPFAIRFYTHGFPARLLTYGIKPVFLPSRFQAVALKKTDISDHSGGTVTECHRVPFAGVPLNCSLILYGICFVTSSKYPGYRPEDTVCLEANRLRLKRGRPLEIKQGLPRMVTCYPALYVQVLKSISLPHLEHLWVLSNSSEKISLDSPHSGHLQVNDFRFLKFSNPGQCWGVLMTVSLF